MPDEKGVDFLGMRLVVVLIAAALLLSAAAAFVEGQADRISRDRARDVTARIASLAGAEYAAGDIGSGTSISVAIPCCVRKVSFSGHLYSIEFNDGSNETHTSSCPFMPATLYSGEHRLDMTVVNSSAGTVSMEVRDAG